MNCCPIKGIFPPNWDRVRIHCDPDKESESEGDIITENIFHIEVVDVGTFTVTDTEQRMGESKVTRLNPS